jgi:hypothetical protein
MRASAGPPADTDPEAHRVQMEAYRRMGGRGRSEVMFRLNAMARGITSAGIRARHPEYDDEQVRLALFRLVLGDALFRRLWPGRDLLQP